MTTPATAKSPDHIAVLDGVRGYAALTVVLTHMMGFFHHRLPVEAGFLAVDLFFVMSGLVIEKSYGPALRDGSMTIRGFIRKRLVRLYPLYLLGGLLGCLSYLRHTGGDPILILATLASVVTMLPQAVFLLGGPLFVFNSPSWSLSVEMYCGIAFAGLSPRVGTPILVTLAITSLAVLTIGMSLNSSLNLGHEWASFGYGYARFCYSYTVGILIWRHRQRIPRFKAWAPLALAIAMYFPNLPASNVLRLVWIGLVLPIGVVAAMQWNVPGWAQRFCSFLGQISYPVYIIHVPVLVLTTSALGRLWGLGEWDDPRTGAIAVMVIIAASIIVTYFVEPVLRKWFARLIYREGQT